MFNKTAAALELNTQNISADRSLFTQCEVEQLEVENLNARGVVSIETLGVENVTAETLNVSGEVSAESASLSGGVSADSVNVTGAVSAGSVGVSGSVNASDVTTSTLTTSGDVNLNSTIMTHGGVEYPVRVVGGSEFPTINDALYDVKFDCVIQIPSGMHALPNFTGFACKHRILFMGDASCNQYGRTYANGHPNHDKEGLTPNEEIDFIPALIADPINVLQKRASHGVGEYKISYDSVLKRVTVECVDNNDATREMHNQLTQRGLTGSTTTWGAPANTNVNPDFGNVPIGTKVQFFNGDGIFDAEREVESRIGNTFILKDTGFPLQYFNMDINGVTNEVARGSGFVFLSPVVLYQDNSNPEVAEEGVRLMNIERIYFWGVTIKVDHMCCNPTVALRLDFTTVMPYTFNRGVDEPYGSPNTSVAGQSFFQHCSKLIVRTPVTFLNVRHALTEATVQGFSLDYVGANSFLEACASCLCLCSPVFIGARMAMLSENGGNIEMYRPWMYRKTRLSDGYMAFQKCGCIGVNGGLIENYRFAFGMVFGSDVSACGLVFGKRCREYTVYIKCDFVAMLNGNCVFNLANTEGGLPLVKCIDDASVPGTLLNTDSGPLIANWIEQEDKHYILDPTFSTVDANQNIDDFNAVNQPGRYPSCATGAGFSEGTTYAKPLDVTAQAGSIIGNKQVFDFPAPHPEFVGQVTSIGWFKNNAADV